MARDRFHLPRIHAAHADLRAVVEAGNGDELRVHVERVIEEHPSIADHEEPEREQQRAAQHERAYRRQTFRWHLSVPV